MQTHLRETAGLLVGVAGVLTLVGSFVLVSLSLMAAFVFALLLGVPLAGGAYFWAWRNPETRLSLCFAFIGAAFASVITVFLSTA